jgi:hypothetical protein
VLRIKSGKALMSCLATRHSAAPSGKLYQTTKPFYEKTLRTHFKKSQIVGDYVICRIFQIHSKPSNLPISNLQTSYLPNLISRRYGLYTTGSIGISFYPRRFCVPAGRQVLVLLDITKREFKLRII